MEPALRTRYVFAITAQYRQRDIGWRYRNCEPTGRAKCAPGDRLREAIHRATKWIASELTLLAMT
jgi:hypothetical protein